MRCQFPPSSLSLPRARPALFSLRSLLSLNPHPLAPAQSQVWSYGASVEPVLSSIVRFRNDVLAPYVLELGQNVSKFGVPTLRPLWFEFPGDTAAASPDCEDQFSPCRTQPLFALFRLSPKV